jgi:glycosyltransferase involved in cell wall biosynthesis
MKGSNPNLELTILMPCLNEEETLGICIRKAKKFLTEHHISGEVLISDNGSTDNSKAIAIAEGARLVHAPKKGYGAALIAGICEAKGKYVIMGDADNSYDFSKLELFIEKLREGNDLVMGNRFRGGIQKNAMPFLHRYIGNPVLSFMGRLFFKSKVGDFHCGLRGFNKEKILELDLKSPGMEFASEMVVKATIADLQIIEVPTKLHHDGRSKPPHLNTWQDGWRHFTFLLIYSPKWLFFIPSLTFLVLSLVALITLLPGTIYFNNIGLNIHTLTISGALAIVSYQLFLFAVFIRIFSINMGLFPARKKHIAFSRYFTLERGLVIGGVLLLSGIALFFALLMEWKNQNFGQIENVSETFRLLIPSIVLSLFGIQTIFSSFFIRILNLKESDA